MSEARNPFGVNKTKRFVSKGGENDLFNVYPVEDHGSVELVDYMGGDMTVERVATAGHGRQIIPNVPGQREFLRYLATGGIEEPFTSVQLKFSITSPIEAALKLVYEPRCSVNEYSGRYSVMINSSFTPSVQRIANMIQNTEENRNKDLSEILKQSQKIYDVFSENRKAAYADYTKLNDLDMARELSRIGLGIDNHTKFFWKIDLLSLHNFANAQSQNPANTILNPYLDELIDIASNLAPDAWSALDNRIYEADKELKLPNDDIIVDSPLSPPQWEESDTRRVTVPELEKQLFTVKKFLDHGEFQIVDYMGEDASLAQAARTSYGDGTKMVSTDKGLINTLVRDLHTSPIEMCELAFESKAPVFIDPRQAGRHRTLDNHGFMGFVPIGSQFYFPPESEMKYQDRTNRQGRGKDMDPEDMRSAKEILLTSLERERDTALKLRELGAPEQIVRESKGVGFYTKRWRTGDTHNLGHFLMLRLDAHAQKEIRDYATLVDEAHRLHTPTANAALKTYTINGIRLSEKEINLISEKGLLRDGIDLEDLSLFEWQGFVLSKKVKDETSGEEKQVRELGREGQALKTKLKKLQKK